MKFIPKKLNKVIIPVAGLGTRMLPATKAVPKEMLPILKKPIIQYIVEEATYAGFKEVVLVTHSSKNSIENHFDKSFELEAKLEKRIKRSLLEEIRSISSLNISIQSVRQHDSLGLGHAILCAKKIIGEDPFGVILPDMIISENKKNDGIAFKKMKEDFDSFSLDSILLAKAKRSDLYKYGVAKFNKNKNSTNKNELMEIIEKPLKNKAPSSFFAAGRYIFNNQMMSHLQKVKPDKFGEIQLTDAINSYLKRNKKIKTFFLSGKIFDCGDITDYLFANLEFASKDKKLKRKLINYLTKE